MILWLSWLALAGSDGGATLTASDRVTLSDHDLVVASEERVDRELVPLPPPWWEAFGDPQLDALIAAAFAENPDVGAAAARIEQARAVFRQERAGLLPQISAVGSTSTSPFRSVGFQFGGLGGLGGGLEDPPSTIQSASAMLQASWDVDVFGRQIDLSRASRYDAVATIADAGQLAVTYSQLVTDAYFDQVAAKARVLAIEQQIDAAAGLLEVLQLRFERGEASGLDVLQQRQQLASTRALLPLARAQVRTAAQQLAVLVGRSPADPVRDVPSELPELAPLPFHELPTHTVARRPDLVAAEARVDAAEARKRAAVKALLPAFQISAGAGWQANKFTEWNTQDTWSFGTSVSVPLFTGGRIRAGMTAARAAEDAAALTYGNQLLTALGEAANAIALEEERRELLAARRDRLEAAELAYDASRARYVEGLATYLEVLTAYNAWLQAELDVVQAERDLLAARVQLHDALGGEPLATVAPETP